MKLRLPLPSVLLLSCAAFLFVHVLWLHQRDVGARSSSPELAVGTAAEGPLMSDMFAAWMQRGSAAGGFSEQEVAIGVELATAREGEMLALIRDDPQAALARAVDFAEYSRLPEPVRAHVERPFSAQAELHALPVCASMPGSPGVSHEVIHELSINGETYTASVFGRRARLGSKESAPLQGITLGGLAAVREEVFQLLVDAGDATEFPEAQADPGRCFASGDPLGAGAVTALAGGKQFHFASEGVLAEFDRRVGEFDLEPGPHTGSRVILLMADGVVGDGGGGAFNWEAAGAEVALQADAWTETPKDVYFIRVDFSDLPGASISQASLADILNSSVTDTITAMSYGKTSIIATVSPLVVRMPSPKAHYLPSDNNALHNDAKAAAAAQIGGFDPANYDIVGVHFGNIGIKSGTSNYAGLAGGSRQWLQGTSSSNVIIHEFGHNYGIGHASFWQTSDGSVVGTGSNDEYGDDFDIMGNGSNSAHFHMQAKEYLDWISPSQWTDVTAAGSGNYRVYRFDDPNTVGANRALRITKAESPPEYYWLGCRKNLSDNRWLQAGAYLIWQRPGFERSWLLDTTPGSAAGRDDGAVVPGKTYSDSTAGVHITTLATGGTAPDEWVDVAVNLGSFGGNRAPTATLSGPMLVDAREDVEFSVSGSDADGDTLAYHWDFGDSTVAENTVSQTRSWAVGGSYTVRVTVTDMKGGTVTKSQAVTVSDPLDRWTSRDSGTPGDLFDIATDGVKLVAVGSRSGTYRTSTDGVTWEGGTVGPNIYLRGIVWDGAQFLAAGQDYEFTAPAGWRGVIYTSPDGSSWTERHFGGEELRDIATSGSVHVAVGDGGEIWRSSDGASWNPIASGTATDLKGVSYGGGQFVAVGSGSSGGPAVVLSSADGSTWSNTSSGAGTASWQGFYDVQYCNDRFLASGWYSKIRHSLDGGATFTTARTETEQIPGFAYGAGIYLAVGEDTTDFNVSYIQNLISTDGQTWAELATDPTQSERNAAIYFGGTFLTVGNGGEIWQSDPFAASPATGGFASWSERYFPGSQIGPVAAADDDGDGEKNLQEYASGTDPTLASSTAAPVCSEVGGYLTLTVTKDPAATDVLCNVEISADLFSWSSEGTVVVMESEDSLVVRSATPAAAAGTPREFMRAVFTLIE